MNTILFDLDGTLIDTQEGILNCLVYAMESMGFEPGDRESLQVFLGPPLDLMFAEYCGFTPRETQEAVRKFRERYALSGMVENTLYPGMKEALNRLSGAGMTLCVATSKLESFARKILERHGILSCFREVAGASPDGRVSTKAQVLAALFERLGGVEPEETIMVGDRKYDVEGAKTYGIPTLGVTYGFGSQEELREAGALLLASTPGQMADRLLKATGEEPRLRGRIREVLGEFGVDTYGFSPVSEGGYPCALSYLIPYDEPMDPQSYREPVFEANVSRAKERMEQIQERLSELFQEEGLEFHIPEPSQRDEEELLAEFSFKDAARKAGLGWIGMHDGLVTRRFGAQLRLGAILLGREMTYGEPQEKSLCPDGCGACVRNCPHQALKGRRWEPGIERSELIDYKLCNEKRSLFLERFGRKNACGRCMVSCPRS